jgi:hypothetical protein
MSDNSMNRTEHTLLGTDNAMTWAEEFCRIFNDKTIVRGNESGQFISEGTMVGWFANAMQTAVMLHEKRRAVTEAVPESSAWINEADRIDYAPQFGEEEDDTAPAPS